MCNFSLKLISLGSKLPRLISRIQFALTLGSQVVFMTTRISAGALFFSCL